MKKSFWVSIVVIILIVAGGIASSHRFEPTSDRGSKADLNSNDQQADGENVPQASPVAQQAKLDCNKYFDIVRKMNLIQVAGLSAQTKLSFAVEKDGSCSAIWDDPVFNRAYRGVNNQEGRLYGVIHINTMKDAYRSICAGHQSLGIGESSCAPSEKFPENGISFVKDGLFVTVGPGVGLISSAEQIIKIANAFEKLI